MHFYHFPPTAIDSWLSKSFCSRQSRPAFHFFIQCYLSRQSHPPIQSISSFTTYLFLLTHDPASPNTLRSSLFKSVLVSSSGRVYAQRGLYTGVFVDRFVQVKDTHGNSEIANLSHAGTDVEDGLFRTVHTPDLLCIEDSDHTVTDVLKIFARLEDLLHFYPLQSDDHVFKTLGRKCTSGFYACGTLPMRVIGSADVIKLHSTLDAYTSDVRAGELTGKNFLELPDPSVEEDLHGEKLSIVSLDSR